MATNRLKGTLDALVVGSGFVGLAIARCIALSGRSVGVIDLHSGPCMETSARNSEVVHAGLYYAHGSAKARLCRIGRDMLYDYCESKGVAYKKRGKLIVATSTAENAELFKLIAHARGNGVNDLRSLSPTEVASLEPHVRCTAAVLSPSSGVVDTRAFVAALERDCRDAGVQFAFGTAFVSADVNSSNNAHEVVVQSVDSREKTTVQTRAIVNAAGLGAQAVARRISGLKQASIPPLFLAKGNYFALKPSSPVAFNHLVYPLPRDGGLGIHVTVDVHGRAKFGPNVEWLTAIDRSVPLSSQHDAAYVRRLRAGDAGAPTLAGAVEDGVPSSLPNPYVYRVEQDLVGKFGESIRTYCPSIKDEHLEASFAGVRPKMVPRGTGLSGDFIIQSAAPGVVNLFGIESPGLTASLALGEEVSIMIDT